MRDLMRRFFTDESASAAVEYGLVAAGISVSIVVVVHSLGGRLGAAFASTGSALD